MKLRFFLLFGKDYITFIGGSLKLTAMFPLADCLNLQLPISQSEDALMLRRDSDAGYASNGSDLSSPETSVSAPPSSSSTSKIDCTSSRDVNSILNVADDIFSDLHAQNFSAANSLVTNNLLHSKKNSDTEHYTRINVIPESGSVVSVDSVRVDKSLPYDETSVLKHAYVNGEKVAIRFVSKPRISKNGPGSTTQNNLSAFMCSGTTVGKKLTLSSLQAESSDAAVQVNADKASSQHYSTFTDGDMDFLNTLTSDEQNLSDIVSICEDDSNKSNYKEDDNKSYFDDLGLMDPSMLLLPETSQKPFGDTKTQSPLGGDTMQKNMPNSSEECSTQELEVGDVSPSPCMDDENEIKSIVNR